MAQNDELKKLEEEIKRMQKLNSSSKPTGSYTVHKESNELAQFFIGLVMLGIGLFWLFQRTTVSTGGIFGLGLYLGNFLLPSGTVIIPLFIGIVMLFFMDRKIFGWIVTAIGLAIIALSIIMSVRIRFQTTSMFEFVMMFFLIGAGCGLLLKVLFKSNKQ